MTPMHPLRAILKSASLPAAATILFLLGACASSSDREAYFQSRQAVVTAQPGNGIARLALWPSNAWGRSTVAIADRRSTSDIAPKLPAADSTR